MASHFKAKQRNRPAVTTADLQARIRRALEEGRTQQALELARSLFKQDPTPEHVELLKQATLARARQLRSSGYTKDAGTVLSNAADLGGAEFLKQLAEELARCGDIQRAQSVLVNIEDPLLRERVENQAADAAMRQGAAGRNLLSEALRPQFDLVRQAFAQMAAGQDEAARDSLQGIGLRSPFLEWKLLVRGFLAYYQNDNERALENWQRLNAERLPARLAAPFRFLIDPAFRQAQPPAVQNQLQKVADQFQGTPVISSLRTLQNALARDDQLSRAFQLAETMVPILRVQAPALVSRLASCFHWAIIHGGTPDDAKRYERIFGPAHDDPRLDRMAALAAEHHHGIEDANDYWRDFQQWLEQDASWGPVELRQRARALVWKHMGDNAAAFSDLAERLPPFLRRLAPRRQALKPGAEECYKKSLTLAPDSLACHEALFALAREQHKGQKAIQVGRALLKRFPEHVATLEALGQICHEGQQYGEAAEYYQRALKVNPLERRLRDRLATTHLFHARSLVDARHFDEARRAYQAALALEDDKSIALTKWAACELKAGNSARAEELILQARQAKPSALDVAHRLTIEAIRFKLPVPLKKRFAGEFERCLQEATPDPNVARSLVENQAAHRALKIKYHGQLTHEKKVLAYFDQTLAQPWSEEALEAVCDHLLTLKATKLLDKTLRLGQKAFPGNPVFILKVVEARIARNSASVRSWQVRKLLEKAQRLAEALPRNDRQHKLLQEIQDLQDLGQEPDPMSGFGHFMEMMDDMFAAEFDDDEDDDDEDYF